MYIASLIYLERGLYLENKLLSLSSIYTNALNINQIEKERQRTVLVIINHIK